MASPLAAIVSSRRASALRAPWAAVRASSAWLMQPGKSGNHTPKPPASVCSITAAYFGLMCVPRRCVLYTYPILGDYQADAHPVCIGIDKIADFRCFYTFARWSPVAAVGDAHYKRLRAFTPR